MSTKQCSVCKVKIDNDYMALNKKLLGRRIQEFYCADCLAEYIGCTTADLEVKIEEFKEAGCGLFK